MTPDQIKQFVNDKASRKSLIESQLKDKRKLIDNNKSLSNNLIEARRILTETSKATQMQFKEYVESLVTSAIQTVFPEGDYKFIADYVVKSNRTEVNLLVQQGDKEPYIPEDEQGGGLLDTLSFALRIVLWSLENPRSRNTIIMDEPFKWAGRLTKFAGNMMKEISQKLNLQIIMVTHSEDLMEIADRSWVVSRDQDKISVVKRMDQAASVPKLKRRMNAA